MMISQKCTWKTHKDGSVQYAKVGNHHGWSNKISSKPKAAEDLLEPARQGEDITQIASMKKWFNEVDPSLPITNPSENPNE